jgi:type II secretory pathway pseudopilin PulG
MAAPDSVRVRARAGYTVVELLLAIAILVTLAGISIPLTTDAIDGVRASMAARYLEGRIMHARVQAIRRSANVALRFEPAAGDYSLAEYLDGNGNGVRSAEIASGVDPLLSSRRLLAEGFTGVSFGLGAGTPDVDGIRSAAPGDGVRVGVSRMLSLSPDGTATSGTLYLHGRRHQYAIRILGATGRTRLLYFHPGTGAWLLR